MLNELARQCGHHFEAEGVKVIEFAQSGIRPLLRFAHRMGIEWHVLVDGDDAGKNTRRRREVCYLHRMRANAII